MYLAIWGLNEKGKTFVMMNHHPGGDVGNNNIIYPIAPKWQEGEMWIMCGMFQIMHRHKGGGFRVQFGDLSLMDNAKDRSSTLHSSWTYIYIYISLWEMVKMTFVMERLIISVLEWSTCFSCDNPCAWTLGKMICAIKIKQKSCMYAFSEMQIHHFTCRRKVCASGYDYWRGWWHQLWSHNLRCFLFVYRL